MLILEVHHFHDQARAVRGHAGIVGAIEDPNQIPHLERFISDLRNH